MGGAHSTPLHPSKVLAKQQKRHPVMGPFLRFADYNPKTQEYTITALYIKYIPPPGADAPKHHRRPHLPHLSSGKDGDKQNSDTPKADSPNADTPKYGDAQNNGTASEPQSPQSPPSPGSGKAPTVRFTAEANPKRDGSELELSYTEEGSSTPSKVKPFLLDEWKGWHFYRFDVTLTCKEKQTPVSYHVNDPAVPHPITHTFYVPPANGSWHFAFYSCNGFHEPEPAKEMKGIQPMWRDLMVRHKEKPLQLGIGGGDQIYLDEIWRVPSLKNWLAIKDRSARNEQPFSERMVNEVQDIYMALYLKHWDEAVFKDAQACIPQINTWDDHDIWDGWGSYPTTLLETPVFQGCFKAARRFYAVLQLHTTPERAHEDGYFGTKSWCQLKCLGLKHALLLPDMRSERTQQQIVSPETWSMMEKRVMELPPSVEHLLVVSAVPFIYPEVDIALPAARCINDISRNCFGCVTKIHESGLDPGFYNAFGTVDLLDDLLDGWNADVHKEERQKTVEMFQRIAEKRQMRVSFLAGDVHCGAVGSFFSDKETPVEKDHRMMVNVTSSAIGNAPPPEGVVTVLNKHAKRQMLNEETAEELRPLSNQPLDMIRGTRNWCELTTSPGPAPDGSPLYGGPSSETSQGSSISFELRFEKVNDGMGVRPNPKIETYSLSVPALRMEKTAAA